MREPIKRASTLGFIVLMIAAATGFAAEGILHSELTAKLAVSQPDEMIPIMITMQEQADYQDLIRVTDGWSKQATREYVVRYLQDLAETSQREVRFYLERQQAAGKVQRLQSVFIVNLLHCKATPEVIRGLDHFPGVEVVTYDPERYMLLYERPNPAEISVPLNKAHESDGLDEIAWGVQDINAPAVWNLGYNGTGVIVAMIDTGVNYNHADLADHMWNGGAQYPNHGWDFYNNDNDPMDDGSASQGGHGTHTAGSVASDGTAGSQCGVAPNATIMALKVLSGNGSGSEGPVISAINFAVAHNADIFSMSLGWQSTSQRAQFRTACNNALAAGVIGAIAAGNEGQYLYIYPIPGNVRTPGDVPPPWLSPYQTLTGGLSCVVTVGATNSSHVYASFTSRGPVTWSNVSPWNDYAYNPGMGLIDPDVSAPGENIKSCWFLNNYGYSDGWSGTSMSTPHVAGTMALMLQKNPNLTPAQIDQYLEQTALDWGATGKDNIYGAGRIDALAAVSAVPGGTPPNVDITMTPINPPIQIPAGGGSFSFNVTLANNGSTPVFVNAWIMQYTPGGSWQGPMLGPVPLTLANGSTITRQRTQSVPSTASPGTYTYRGYLGIYTTNTKYDSSSFTYTKLSTGDGNPLVHDWANSGASFDQPFTGSTPVPADYALGQNYPNPFNPVTTIPFSLPERETVSLQIFNLRGEVVAMILSGELEAGAYQASYDASALGSGIYIYRLTTQNFTQSHKMTLIK